MGLGQKVLQTYTWMTDAKRERYTNFAVAGVSAAAKAWWVHYVGPTHQKVIDSPPELVAILSAFTYPYFALSFVTSAAKKAASDLRAQTSTVGFALGYTVLEYFAYQGTGMRNPGAATLPSFIFGIPSTMMLAYCVRREAPMPMQLLNLGKEVGKVVYNSGRRIGSLFAAEEFLDLGLHEKSEEK